MELEVYIKDDNVDKIKEIILGVVKIPLRPCPFIEIKKGERYGFLNLKKAKEDLYSNVESLENNLYTREEYIKEFGIDPENDTRPTKYYVVQVVRMSGRSMSFQFNTRDEAREYIKLFYPEYNVRVV